MNWDKKYVNRWETNQSNSTVTATTTSRKGCIWKWYNAAVHVGDGPCGGKETIWPSAGDCPQTEEEVKLRLQKAAEGWTVLLCGCCCCCRQRPVMGPLLFFPQGYIDKNSFFPPWISFQGWQEDHKYATGLESPKIPYATVWTLKSWLEHDHSGTINPCNIYNFILHCILLYWAIRGQYVSAAQKSLVLQSVASKIAVSDERVPKKR